MAWPAKAERLTVWREAPVGTGVESSSLILSYQDGEEKATTFSSLTICGANVRIRLL